MTDTLIKKSALKNALPELNRRGFMKGASGLSFALAFGAGGTAHLLTPTEAKAIPGHLDISAWVRISPDNTITIKTPGAEMGQGSMTSVPLMLAEEMDANWDHVFLEWAPANPRVYGYSRMRRGKIQYGMTIVGSRAVMMYHKPMRIAGAQVRKVLMDSAAKEWGVPVSQVRTEPNLVIGPKKEHRLTYGQIAAFAKPPRQMPKISKSDLKKKSDFRLIGKSVPRRDTPEKVNGTAQYAIDVQVPGMVYASTVHSPIQGGRPKSWNEAALKKLPGFIRTVKLKEGVAVIADNYEHVLAARVAIEIKWSKEKAKGYDSESTLEKDYAKKLMSSKTKSKKIVSKGKDSATFKNAAKTYSADFRSDYGYHAQMEPLNAVAHVQGDRVEIWEGTQGPGRSVSAIARALKFKKHQVTHHQQYMGGGFGRRSKGDYTIEAALISKAIKKPVKMIWTREEDINYGMFRPQSFQHLEAALDGSGNLVGWRHGIIGDGRRLLSGGAKISKYYKVPNQLVTEKSSGKHGIRTKHWRAVAHVFNVYAIESLIDQIAVGQGVDPLEYRLKHVPVNKKARSVLEKVGKMSDWKAKRPKGRAIGLSMTERSGSLGAQVAEISVDRKSGKIKVHKVWSAVDGGVVVQPDAATRNIESGVMYAMSSLLKERATIKNGTVEQSNFNDYHVLRMSDAPEELHVEFLDRDTKPTGLGEIGGPGMGAAIANAFFALTGKRLNHMPFTEERVLAALKS
ncbi:MAG: xanthine dehydrogenase family protein molybdopterin-binding subunit [Rhodospirillales bacterium]|jgi:isoquinoline 1-oxidoreductase beta subunit|nr:xanthine dehydrogenase family protein molybdopterin-binding subunit [Rhodospirillales bacterium]MBT4007004.1 xanthine dehydrogenase family protein molybdopterin-binding subunit [Rhodospirillales bacterium]MBT5075316.1 xanthine dehydrogenase family protein molybdopterin-binding subunit [Rhodospirillales bacterium]MBT5112864.1 xanthine dehydrogenase family protein molybdopterin-binding subunit [Rhodospirillales bacterium]MBT5673635.1 xanthine dehydrogenase family protein molybdopterin-binding 